MTNLLSYTQYRRLQYKRDIENFYEATQLWIAGCAKIAIIDKHRMIVYMLIQGKIIVQYQLNLHSIRSFLNKLEIDW